MAHQTIDGTRFLDDMYTKLQRPTPTLEAIHELFTGLTDIRRVSSPAAWAQFAQSDCRRHPVRHLIHQDPISRRSFLKPRGYAGDAVILDFLYEEASVREELQ